MSKVTLECGHTLTFTNVAPPVAHDEVWCVRCDAPRKVAQAPDEYRIRCQQCTYGKRFGMARELSYIRAVKHARKRGHIVRIYNGNVIDRTVGDGQPALTLPSGDTPMIPPF